MTEPSSPIHHVLWTGGWDSSFRVLDLAIRHGRTVQPWYVIDPERATAAREIRTMTRIRETLLRRDPPAGTRIRPMNLRPRADIRPDPEHAAALERAGRRLPMFSQQGYLPLLIRQEGVPGMELGSTADDHMEERFANVRIVQRADAEPDDWWYVDPDGAPPDDLRIWGRYRFPILTLTKLQMAGIADVHGFRDLMEMTWFCRQPTVLGNPCGFCVPCTWARDAGLHWRVPRPTRTRRALNRAKQSTIRRGLVLRANLGSLSSASRRGGRTLPG